MAYVLDFSNVRMKMLDEVGGRSASLGEISAHLGAAGICVPDGFAVTASAYRHFLRYNHLDSALCALMRSLDCQEFSNLAQVGAEARAQIVQGLWPEDLREEIAEAYARLAQRYPGDAPWAVRGSPVAADDSADFLTGGGRSSFNVGGLDALLEACRNVFATLYSDDAIRGRTENGVAQLEVALPVCVKRMVRSDLASSGVAFRPDAGAENTADKRTRVELQSTYGLGTHAMREGDCDIFSVLVGSGKNENSEIVLRRLGSKERTRMYAPANGAGETTRLIETPAEKRAAFSLSDEDVIRLAVSYRCIQEYYGQSMDVAWAKDGGTGELFIVNARPRNRRIGQI